MFCISINYKNTPVDIREKFAFTKEEQKEFLSDIKNITDGCVLICTCNRVEVYFTGDKEVFTAMEEKVAVSRNIQVNVLRKYSMNYSYIQGIEHLYKVVCGMDSMVLGEVEIIRQIKDGYMISVEAKTVNKEINMTFQGALATAKEIASNTKLTKLPVSVGTLSAKEAVRFCRENNKKNVLVIGATGKTGSIVVKDIAAIAQDISIIGTSRHHGTLGERFLGCSHFIVEDYNKRYELVRWADVIISATASPHYIFISDEMIKILEKDSKKRLFLDLAVPKDIDPLISQIKGCRLKDIDYIRTLSRKNNESKAKTISEIEPYVLERVDEVCKNMFLSEIYANEPEKIDRLKRNGEINLVYRLKEKLEYDAFKKAVNSICSNC